MLSCGVCVSHVHRPSPMEAGVTVVGMIASLLRLVYLVCLGGGGGGGVSLTSDTSFVIIINCEMFQPYDLLKVLKRYH